MQAIYAHIAVVGIGAMGRGIAQIAAQAGSTVALYDQQPAAIAAAQQAIAEQWDKQVEKGRLDPTAAAAYKERLRAATSLAPVRHEQDQGGDSVRAADLLSSICARMPEGRGTRDRRRMTSPG